MLDWLYGMLERDPTAVVLPIACLCGLLMGTERELRGHRGQLRVCVLVCVAAAAFSDLVVTRAESSNWANGFGSIAQGVGFLGAGLIMKDGATVRGVSTAATLWCVAAAGAAAGAREIVAALLVTLIVLGANLVLRPINIWARRRQTADTADGE
ncbi:MgtC/SapB family protein [Roseococcus pinisoli]|uniref:Protein MgtC n=1 Tax=Roseococcus pinisoli TaxID=2835040 RepID=A0ABS5QFX6_9PROT|nr:MgtC/SapB family protein [uncultured Roseococcus sp.]MBS7812584.1 MgtC/SapB family protein [Roseococcus pinisoli]